MNWFKIISDYFKSGYYTAEQVKIFVAKGKITADEYQQITGQVYVP